MKECTIVKNNTLYNIPHLNEYYITKFGKVYIKKNLMNIKPNRFSRKLGFMIRLTEDGINDEYPINWILMNVFCGITNLPIIEDVKIDDYDLIDSRNLRYDDEEFYEIAYESIDRFTIADMEYRVIPDTEHCLFINKEGAVYSFYQKRFIRRSYGKKHPYPMISPLLPSCKRYHNSIHRILGIVWLDDFSEELSVNHIDARKYNSWIGNLEMVTHTENLYHAIEHGLKGYRVSNDQIHMIAKLIGKGYTAYQIYYMIHNKSIQNIELIENLIYRILSSKKYKQLRTMYNLEHLIVKTNYNQIITDEQVHQVCQLLQDHYEYSNKKISELTGVKPWDIQKIREKKNFVRISESYDFDYVKTRDYCIDDQKIHDVCKLLEQGMLLKNVADETGVSYSLICEINRGDSHTDISSQYNIKYEKPNSLSESDVIRICEMILDRKSDTEISKHVSCSNQNISDIRRGNIWTNISKNYGIPNPETISSPNPRNYMTEELINKVIDLVTSTNMSYREIGEKLDIPMHTVRNTKKKYKLSRPNKLN